MKRKTQTKKTEAPSSFRLQKNFSQKSKLSGKLTNRKDLRFSVSLVVLMAFLSFSVLLLLFSLINGQSARAQNKKIYLQNVGRVVPKKNSSVTSSILNDTNLDFQIAVPATWSGWIYKTGFVQSPADDSLSDQYLQIFLPNQRGKTSSNFDESQKKMITIIKFMQKEWQKLETGCAKENISYCEAMGKKITEKNGDVYAYIAEPECPKTFEARCREIDKMLESFRLK
jgi:hypothetical protein